MSPTKRPLTQEELGKRDQRGIEISRSLLEAGDTLVYIKFPSDELLLDAAGTPISKKPHRVHSSKLLATGSTKFQELLENEIKQRRMRARYGFTNKMALPPGIQYVLDLTPPDEGDDAVILLEELTCSPGICHWYTSELRCGCHHDRVGGKDEMPQLFLDEESDDQKANTHVPSNHDDGVGETQDKDKPITIIPRSYFNAGETEDAALKRILHQSKLETLAPLKAYKHFHVEGKDRKLDIEKIEDYSQIRHRAGIGRLLRTIEGMNPGLDSAPKVWTLFALAKYFECTAVVVSL